MTQSSSPLPRVGSLPMWGIGLAAVVGGTAVLLFRGRTDLVTTGLELVVLQGFLLWLGTQRVRYLTLVTLVTTWVFAGMIAVAVAYELHGWSRAHERLANEPAALAAAIGEYEALGRRCARCSVSTSEGRKTRVEEAIVELRADSQELRSLLLSQVRSHRRSAAICALFFVLYTATGVVIQRWYRTWRSRPAPASE